MEPIVVYLGSLMLRSLAIAVLAWLASLCFRSSAAKHALWTVVLILMLLMPFADVALPQAMVSARVIPREVLYLSSSPAFYPAPAKAVSHPTPGPLEPLQVRLNILASRFLGLPLYLLYLSIAGVLLARVGMAYIQVRRLKRSGVPIALPMLAELAASHGLRAVPELREAEGLHVPVTLGFLRPVVERVLSLSSPGVGVLPRTAWVFVLVLASPVLYAAAAFHVGPAPRSITPVITTLTSVPEPVATPLSPLPETIPFEEVLQQLEPLVTPQAQQPPAEVQSPPAVKSQFEQEAARNLQSRSRRVPSDLPLAGIVGSLFGRQAPDPPPAATTPGASRSTVDASSPTNVYCPESSCVFTITGVQDRTVSIRGENPGSSSNLTYTCLDCSYALGARPNGSLAFTRAADLDMPGVVFTLSADGASLTIDCKAQKCAVVTLTQRGGEIRQATSQRGNSVPIIDVREIDFQAVTVPTSSQTHFRFSRP